MAIFTSPVSGTYSDPSLEGEKPRHTLQKLLLAQHLDQPGLIEEIQNTFYPPCTHPILTVECIPDQREDGVTYKMLHNLPDSKLEELLTHINRVVPDFKKSNCSIVYDYLYASPEKNDSPSPDFANSSSISNDYIAPLL
ncbi:hypothetical protein HPB48_008936 [Haemaphysalis longicornis]|uniref:Uncharacterized protein n=1 Tax=Haemaphysalis longicornis TaxID=44386 RepID=A0A9J6H490_HAELO|nr:hypothetical protein HPB48_008936 [Haemaphysalis longicornis]